MQYFKPTHNPPNVFTTANLYWIDDMQHALKETVINFGTLNAAALNNLGRTVQFAPVASVPASWVASARVTLDMGGEMPGRTIAAADTRRLPDYTKFAADQWGATPLIQKLGWTNFGIDLNRQYDTRATGGWPHSFARYYINESPSEYYLAQDSALGELSLRPEWLTGYRWATDFAALKLDENPYPDPTDADNRGGSWRAFEGHAISNIAIDYKPGTGRVARSREYQHGWHYHLEDT
jgi:hypothetical protein